MSKEDIERLDGLIAGLRQSVEELRKSVEDIRSGVADSRPVPAAPPQKASPAAPLQRTWNRDLRRRAPADELAPADPGTALLSCCAEAEMVIETKKVSITPAGEEMVAAQWLDDKDEFEFNQSIWDTTIFIGHPCLGSRVSAVLSLAYVLNLVLQLYFCFIVHHYMVPNNFSEDHLESLLRFRVGVGHNIRFADIVGEQSLTAQVCNEDFSLALAGGTSDLHVLLSNFRDGGQPLMALVMVLWLSSTMKELNATWNCASALLQLTQSPGGLKLVLSEDKDVTRLKYISRMRLCCAFGLALVPRAMIALILGYVGVCWLGRTSSMGDLVLNAVALAFVTDLDELIFTIFAPIRAKTLIGNLEPLRVPPGDHLGKSGWHRSLVKMLLVAGSLCIVYETILTPFFWTLAQAEVVMCGGEKDFVFAQNAASGIIHVAKSRASKSQWTEEEKAMLQVAGPRLENEHWNIDDELLNLSRSPDGQAVLIPPAPNIGAVSYDTSHFQTVRHLLGSTVAESAELLACRDLSAGATNKSALHALQVLMHNDTIASCHDVAWQACTWYNMTKLRALCPMRCNCHKDPTYTWGFSGYFRTAAGGCPAQCAVLAATFSEIRYAKSELLESKECVDAKPEELIFNKSCADLDLLANPGVRDAGSHGCGVYNSSLCGQYDDDDFSASDLCCVCGGGSTDVKTSVECFDDLTDSCKNMNLEAFWFLTYVTGMFQVKLADQFFPVGVRTMVSFPSAPVGNFQNESEDLSHHVIRGEMARSILHGEWNFMPGMAHPRGLKGCDYITSHEFKVLVNVDVCSSRQFSSVKFLCPRSCGCRSTMYEDYSPEANAGYKDVSSKLPLFSRRKEDLAECPASCVLPPPLRIGDPSWDSWQQPEYNYFGHYYDGSLSPSPSP